MCFYTKGSKLRVATKDIVCYKFMGSKATSYLGMKRITGYISECAQFFYKEGDTYGEKSKWKMFFHWLIKKNITKQGYHSYSTATPTIDCSLPWFGKYRPFVKCIIPKGSLYLHNIEDKEYCSTSIKIIGEIL